MAEPVIRSPRDFPAIEELLSHPALESLIAAIPRPVAADVIRAAVAGLKKDLAASPRGLPFTDLLESLRAALRNAARQRITRVINGTGILVHTNLGRAPLPADLFDELRPLVTGYATVEYDLESGERGSRGVACEQYLATLAGTESACVVNNCAAALLIIINTLANRKRVLISRGELVQIGGGFRIPEILKRAGGVLMETGTTNITTVADYAAGIAEGAALVLKVHRSNFIQDGFTSDVPIEALVAASRNAGIPLVHDIGSGLFQSTAALLPEPEPTVEQSVRAGADLVCFSGDKLFGGVQAGLIVGRAELITKLKKNPLFRTVRADKLMLILLERLAKLYLDGRAAESLPLWRQLAIPVADLYTRAHALLAATGRPEGVTVEACRGYIGGGAAPGAGIDSVALAFTGQFSASRLAVLFRNADPPVIGRIQDNRFLIDLRAIDQTDLVQLEQIIPAVLAACRTTSA